jgi:hypothetical protein
MVSRKGRRLAGMRQWRNIAMFDKSIARRMPRFNTGPYINCKSETVEQRRRRLRHSGLAQNSIRPTPSISGGAPVFVRIDRLHLKKARRRIRDNISVPKRYLICSEKVAQCRLKIWPC